MNKIKLEVHILQEHITPLLRMRSALTDYYCFQDIAVHKKLLGDVNVLGFVIHFCLKVKWNRIKERGRRLCLIFERNKIEIKLVDLIASSSKHGIVFLGQKK